LGGRKGIRPVKNMGGWWRSALDSPDGVAPSRMVGVSASVNLSLHHKVQKFSSGTGSPGWSRKKGRKTVVVVVVFEWVQSCQTVQCKVVTTVGQFMLNVVVIGCLMKVKRVLEWNASFHIGCL